MNRAVIIAAGGSGSRMKGEVPKQLLELHGKPIILYSIEKFRDFDKDIEIIIALHKDYFRELSEIISHHNLYNIELVEGGANRWQSVKHALAVLKPGIDLVGVHDAARPLVSMDTIKRVYQLAEKKFAAVPVVEMNESLRQLNKDSSQAVNREHFRLVQTPQCFKKDILLEAYTKPYDPSFTDDASVVERNGQVVFLTEGNPENIKITYPKDLMVAEKLLQHDGLL